MFIFVGIIISYFYFMEVISDSDQVYSLKTMAVSSHEIIKISTYKDFCFNRM